MRYSKFFFLHSIIFSLVCSCSVGMALSGKNEPNLAVCQTGADRGTVELQLGSPISVATLDEGKTCCVYEYELGNEPSAGRAVFHGAMDVLTLGGWEIIGTPVEGFQGKKQRVTIIYDSNNKIASVNSAFVEKKKDNQESKNEN